MLVATASFTRWLEIILLSVAVTMMMYRVIVLIVTQEDDFYDPSEGSNQLIKPTGGTYRPGGRHL